MELFQKKIGPVFLKEDSDAELFINKMTELSVNAIGTLKEEINKQIKLASYGLVGEKNIAFELKNSDIDMYILHDVYFEYNDMSAQIDYMVFTRRRVYIIECKNLIGNIEIDNNDRFIRTYELFGKQIREGIYSPITQNERHRVVIKNIRLQDKNIIKKLFFDKAFDDNYKSIVVLANPKNILNDRFAKKEVKSKVIRADQLVKFIKEKDKEVTDIKYSNEDMLKLATYFLDKSVANKSDYIKKYEEMIARVTEEKKFGIKENEKNIQQEKICPECGYNLVLRVAKHGINVGEKFYGCSNFPKCRYIEKLKE